MAYRLRLFHCILLPFLDCPFCRNIRIIVKEGYNHSNLAGQIRLNSRFSVGSMPFHTNRRQSDIFHVSENVFRFHSTIQPLANQSLNFAKERLARIVPVPGNHSSWRRQRMLLFYFPAIRPQRAGIVPVRKWLLHIVCDNIILSRNNIAAAVRNAFPLPALSGICSDFDRDLRSRFFCGKLQFRNKR